MGFSDIMAEIEASGAPVETGGTEDFDTENNSEETLEGDGQDGDWDEGEGDNSDETAPQGFDPSSITDPALRAQYQQMQAAFTPRLQEAAELRKQYGDLDPVVVDAVRQYQSLLQSDPIAAREFLVQQQRWLEQQVGVQQQPDPFDGIEPLTPTEEALVAWGRQQWQRQQQLELENQQIKLQRQQEMSERQFAQLEAQYKTTIPLEQRQQVWSLMQRSGINDTALAWKALNFDEVAKRSATRTKEVAKSKQKSPPPPTNRQQRSSPAASKAKGLTGIFDEAWSQFGGG